MSGKLVWPEESKDRMLVWTEESKDREATNIAPITQAKYFQQKHK